MWLKIISGLLLLGSVHLGISQTDSLFRVSARVLSGLPAASQLEVDTEGNLTLLDPDQNRIYRYFALSDFDSSIFVGGYGIREEGFLEPSLIKVRNRQETYVLDEGARRLVLLNTNFKVVGETRFLDIERGQQDLELYPFNFALSPAGEKFLLNRFDNKIYKINAFGELETSFGGLDYGDGALEGPAEVRIRDNSFVLVSDTLGQNIKVFNYFGIYESTIIPKTSFRWQKFRLFGQIILCYDAHNIAIGNLTTNQYREYQVQNPGPILDVALSRQYIYLLRENEVHLYKR
ncbi:MAG: hypothetical protein AAGI38_07720 [Bacteroidota bacterium]